MAVANEPVTPEIGQTVDAAANLAAVNAAIATAAEAAGRKPDEVDLVAVSKTHGPETILPVIAAGLTATVFIIGVVETEALLYRLLGGL